MILARLFLLRPASAALVALANALELEHLGICPLITLPLRILTVLVPTAYRTGRSVQISASVLIKSLFRSSIGKQLTLLTHACTTKTAAVSQMLG